MKKLSILIFILALALSCAKKNNENGNNNNINESTSTVVKAEKVENPQGPEVALNKTDFKIENDFIYYQGNIFTGKITFDTFYKSGYYFVSNGKLTGEAEINYKQSGTKRKEVYSQGSLLKYFVTENGITTEIVFDNENIGLFGKKDIESINVTYDKNAYSLNIKNGIGRMERNGKVFDNLESVNDQIFSVFTENGATYKVYYIYDKTLKEVIETKFKMDSKNDKEEILVEIKKLGTTDINFFAGMNAFNTIMNISETSSSATATSDSNASSETSDTTSSNDSSISQVVANGEGEDDLALLNRVYDEVINKNNPAILNSFSKEKLGYIRNTIFAKKGYIFSAPKYRDYFSSKSWYKGTETNQFALPLSAGERKLIDAIKAKEK